MTHLFRGQRLEIELRPGAHGWCNVYHRQRVGEDGAPVGEVTLGLRGVVVCGPSPSPVDAWPISVSIAGVEAMPLACERHGVGNLHYDADEHRRTARLSVLMPRDAVLRHAELLSRTPRSAAVRVDATTFGNADDWARDGHSARCVKDFSLVVRALDGACGPGAALGTGAQRVLGRLARLSRHSALQRLAGWSLLAVAVAAVGASL